MGYGLGSRLRQPGRGGVWTPEDQGSAVATASEASGLQRSAYFRG